jgi:hypothetical protein
MNTSATINQVYYTTKTTARTTPTGFRRRTMAGALLVMALTVSAIGFAAISHADDTQIPATDPTIAAPPAAAAFPWPQPPPGPWLNGPIDRAFHSHLRCGYGGFDDKFRCGWY